MNRVIEQLYKEVLINDGNTSFKNYQYAIYRYNKNVYIIMKVILDEPNSSFENLYLIILREKFEGKQIDSTNYIKDLAIINDDKLFSEYYFIGRNIPVNHFNFKLLNLIRTKFHLVFFKGLITNVWFSPVTFDKISNSNIEM